MLVSAVSKKRMHAHVLVRARRQKMAARFCPRLGCNAKHEETDLPWWDGHYSSCPGTPPVAVPKKTAATGTPTDIDVPDLTDKTVKGASKALRRDKLVLRKVNVRQVPGLSKEDQGKVVQQNPEADEKARPGDPVDIWITVLDTSSDDEDDEDDAAPKSGGFWRWVWHDLIGF